jgi:hypothetical protein
VRHNGKLLADTKTAYKLIQVESSRLYERIAEHAGFALAAEETAQRMRAVAGSEHGQYDFA